MTKREIASLAIKLMGVFILIKTLTYIPTSLSVSFNVWQTAQVEIAEKVMYTVMSVSFAVIPVVFALLIIVFSDKVSAWLIREQEDMTIELTGSIQKKMSCWLCLPVSACI
ncbi:MAG: hypothetical protein ABFR90_05185 [Planctomycetota bacterium]